MKHGLFGWVDTSVDDLDAAVAFYTALFGWEAERLESPDGASDYVIARKDGKMAAGLGMKSAEMKAQGVPSVWNSYVTVDSVEAIAARAAELGATVLVPPMEITDAGWMTYIMDPQGGALGFWQEGEHKGADAFNEPGFLTWNELVTRDVPGSTEFYSALMPEWTFEESEAGGMPYTTIGLGEGSNGGIMAMGENFPPQVPTHWAVYFAVADAPGDAARVSELGGRTYGGVIETQFGPLVLAEDPEGAAFRMIGPMTPSRSAL